MKFRDPLLSIVLPILLWLLLGAPSLQMAGNLAILAVLILHLYAVIWTNVLFTLFRGDGFTYGAVARAINMLSLAYTFAITWIVLHLAHKQIADIRHISPYAWGFMSLGLLLTVGLPILTSADVQRLPTAKDRRSFLPPRTDEM
jgi:hypothetical protein